MKRGYLIRRANQFRRKVDAGMSIAAIAKQHGVSKACVWAWLHHDRQWTQQKPPETAETVAVLVLSGLPVKQAATRLGVPYATAWAAAKRYGARPQRKASRLRAMGWLRRNQAGESISQIAEADGVPESTVQSAIQRERKRLSVVFHKH